MPSARPDYLEDFLVSLIREFCGAYAPDSEWVKSTVDYFEDDLRRYLGTYFPRSFLETYEIAVELFGKAFGSGVSTDGELKLLDVGCGMGGASLGLLFAVLERFAVKKVVLDGFDANDDSLEFFQKILRSSAYAKAREALRANDVPGAGAEVEVHLQKGALSREKFSLLQADSSYDVILTSKMLNELDVEAKYFRFLENYLPHLTKHGVCFVIDVNDRRDRLHISQHLSKEAGAFSGSTTNSIPFCRRVAKIAPNMKVVAKTSSRSFAGRPISTDWIRGRSEASPKFAAAFSVGRNSTAISKTN